jgi:Histidine kinase-, DNA gyrase B-, and HSP90-like ATPase
MASPRERPIHVSEKALAHLSRGLYRSPASALRELVSNAWDANATVVRITTNYPNFYQIAVEDNGEGFSEEEFVYLMESGGIGNSRKRPATKSLSYGRETIGRYGIGMLGIANICGSFQITSKTKDGKGFKATVRLFDALKTKLDSGEIVHDNVVEVGKFSLQDFDPKKARNGTTIITDDVVPTFINAFQQSLKFEEFEEVPATWMEAVNKVIGKVHSLQQLGDYWKLLWELSASTPIPYLSKRALPEGLISKEQTALQSYNFKLIVDGVELMKPVSLSGNPGGYTVRKIEPLVQTVYGKTLAFHGYLTVQDGKQLKPDELRGILIRIKGVAVGYYDPSMLDYRFNEGPRNRWLTGELFVTQGLEDALNIDRDSFNRFHPEFRAIQEYIHKILQGEIFPDVYLQIKVRSTAKDKARAKTRTRNFVEAVQKTTGSKFSLKTIDVDEADADVRIKGRVGRTEIIVSNPEKLPVKKSNRGLAASLFAAFEVALQERGIERQRQTFRKLVSELLDKW